MPRKNRGYKKEEAFRDARIIVIACEGLREENYFQTLVGKSRQVKLFTLSPKEEIHKSSPKWVRDRAAKFVDKFGLDGQDDESWFVLDIDEWEKSILHEISKNCNDNKKMVNGFVKSLF
ncbi:MAG: RloB domain-containing protein [Saprospiraceae bacterium]|nr:RloB domain-containing protein [Saprospiraceae bacterium]